MTPRITNDDRQKEFFTKIYRESILLRGAEISSFEDVEVC